MLGAGNQRLSADWLLLQLLVLSEPQRTPLLRFRLLNQTYGGRACEGSQVEFQLV